MTDGIAGLTTTNSTTPFSAATAAVPNATIHDGSYNRSVNIDNSSASVFKTTTYSDTNAAKTDADVDCAVVIHGDLA